MNKKNIHKRESIAHQTQKKNEIQEKHKKIIVYN